MFYWMKPLPESETDLRGWLPFIRSEWLRSHFMWFVYALQAVLLMGSIFAGVWGWGPLPVELLVFAAVYLLHEFLHIAVVWRKGNLSLTHAGAFFWLHTDAVLSKGRFWLFMTLPLLTLSMLPALFSLPAKGMLHSLLQYTAWMNLLIGGSDLINSVLILIKPVKAQFCRGFYRTHPAPEPLAPTEI